MDNLLLDIHRDEWGNATYGDESSHGKLGWPGIYLFANRDRNLYVGHARRMRHRFTEHRGMPWWYEAEWIEVLTGPELDDDEYRFVLEQKCIRLLVPEYNSALCRHQEARIRERRGWVGLVLTGTEELAPGCPLPLG